MLTSPADGLCYSDALKNWLALEVYTVELVITGVINIFLSIIGPDCDKYVRGYRLRILDRHFYSIVIIRFSRVGKFSYETCF